MIYVVFVYEQSQLHNGHHARHFHRHSAVRVAQRECVPRQTVRSSHHVEEHRRRLSVGRHSARWRQFGSRRR